MTESEIKAYIASEVAAQLQAITSKDIASESDVPTLSDAEWDTNNSITSLPVVYNGSAWRKIGAGFLRTLRNAAAVVSTAWNALKNNGTSVSWIPTVDTSGNAGKTSPADLAAVLGVVGRRYENFIAPGESLVVTDTQNALVYLVPAMHNWTAGLISKEGNTHRIILQPSSTLSISDDGGLKVTNTMQTRCKLMYIIWGLQK